MTVKIFARQKLKYFLSTKLFENSSVGHCHGPNDPDPNAILNPISTHCWN